MSNSERRSYAVVGVGGVGGYFGGRLALAGRDVRFLLHSDYGHVAAHGLRVRSCKGDFALPRVAAFADAADVGRVDVVLVCLKTTRLPLLRDILPPLVDSRTTVVLIQNGIGVEAAVEALVPGVRLVAGLAFIGAEKIGPGLVDHKFFGNINLAPFNFAPDAELEVIAADFEEAGVPIRLMPYAEARWKKALWNMPYNGPSVVVGSRTDELSRGEGLRLTRALMEEVAGAAKALGVTRRDGTGPAITDREIDKSVELTLQMPPYWPSMKVDYDNRREMEIEFLYRRPIEMAAAAGYDMRMTRAVMMELEILQAKKLSNCQLIINN